MKVFSSSDQRELCKQLMFVYDNEQAAQREKCFAVRLRRICCAQTLCVVGFESVALWCRKSIQELLQPSSFSPLLHWIAPFEHLQILRLPNVDLVRERS